MIVGGIDNLRKKLNARGRASGRVGDGGMKMNKKDFAKLLQGLANAKAHAEGDLRKARRVSAVEVPQAAPGFDVDYGRLSKYSF